MRRDREVINCLVDHHLRHREGILRATFNGQELCLEIAYQGSRTTHLPTVRAAETLLASDIEDGEAAAYAGLRNFIRGLAVDRQKVDVQKSRVIVRLVYAI